MTLDVSRRTVLKGAAALAVMVPVPAGLFAEPFFDHEVVYNRVFLDTVVRIGSECFFRNCSFVNSDVVTSGAGNILERCLFQADSNLISLEPIG